jgi:hypothetical protein
VTATPAYDFSTSEHVSRESCDILVGIVACWTSGLMQENSEARKRESPYLPDPHPRIHIPLPTCRHVPSRSALDFFLLKSRIARASQPVGLTSGGRSSGLDVVGLRALLVCRTWLGGEFGRERTSGSFSWAYARHLVQGSYRGGDVMGRYERLS